MGIVVIIIILIGIGAVKIAKGRDIAIGVTIELISMFFLIFSQIHWSKEINQYKKAISDLEQRYAVLYELSEEMKASDNYDLYKDILEYNNEVIRLKEDIKEGKSISILIRNPELNNIKEDELKIISIE